jgi:hypothetical protein
MGSIELVASTGRLIYGSINRQPMYVPQEFGVVAGADPLDLLLAPLLELAQRPRQRLLPIALESRNEE